MKNRIRSRIDQRLHELSWLHIPGDSVRFRLRRDRARGWRMIWLGPGLLFDPRTGRIQAL